MLNIFKIKYANSNIYNYIYNLLGNAFAKLPSGEEGSLLKLAETNKLEGWCWQTTETAALYLKDTDEIIRGTLGDTYEHSWICFKYEEIEYTLDLCLNILCKRELYERLFKANKKISIPCKSVKDTFNDMQTKIEWDDNIESPLFRNVNEYKVENEKILKINYHKRG